MEITIREQSNQWLFWKYFSITPTHYTKYINLKYIDKNHNNTAALGIHVKVYYQTYRGWTVWAAKCPDKVNVFRIKKHIL